MLALSLIVALMLAAIGASFLGVTDTTAKITEADFTERNLLCAAESGIDQAIATLNRYLAKSSADGETWITPAPDAALKEWTGAATTVFGAGGWTATANGYRKDFGTMTLGNGRTARLRVVVRNVPTLSQPGVTSVVAEVTYNPDGRLAGAGTYAKQYAVWLKRSSRYQNSLVGIKSVKLADNMTVDSYDSRLGSPAPGNLGDKAIVASAAMNDGAITGGNVSVFGYVATGADDPSDNFGANSRIFGKYSEFPYAGASGRGLDPNRMLHDFSANFSTPTKPATGGLLDLNLLLQNVPIVNGVLVLPAGSYRLSNPLNLPKTVTQTTQVVENVVSFIPLLGNVVNQVTKTVTQELSISTIRVVGHVTIVVDGDPDADPATLPSISLSGNTQLVLPLDSSLKIYTPGNLDLQGGGILNGVLNLLTTTGRPQDFLVYGTNTNKADGKRQRITIAGNGNFSGVIDAPNADVALKTGSDASTTSLLGLVDLTTGSDGLGVGIGGFTLTMPTGNAAKYGFQGAVIGYTVNNDGNFNFHYDEALGVFMFPSYTLDTWMELKGADRVNFASYGF